MSKSRQVARRENFNKHFTRYSTHRDYGEPIYKGLESRKERRKLARAYAAGDWKKRAAV